MSKTMNLTEYLNQVDPERMPKVILQPDEYKKGATYTVAGHPSETLIFITSQAFNETFPGHRNEYIKKSDSSVLWTMDKHGNAKSMSCFHIVE